ncbi:hypothetical protein TpMuguga_04g02715 [Theileria parva strain Muguga]|uniref:uncharacterized protein n=1 Tax=Theileria parva strain Muguga TaxID=333668 RepID=UPI001C617E35|nr:uncharacterized protein TpMuguga_04g02715 [Theileria parva strain Muguga]KAF5153227.1 hypothetical protein TpMuguga_04g02715 [Theileria parva strain Muguga]
MIGKPNELKNRSASTNYCENQPFHDPNHFREILTLNSNKILELSESLKKEHNDFINFKRLNTTRIKQLELENSLLKEDNENLSRELLEHSDLLKDHFTLRVYSHDKDLECSNLKKRVESLDQEIYNWNEVVKKLECQLQSKLNIQNLNLTHSVICQNQSKLPKRSLTFPAYFNKGDNTPDSSPFPVNDVDLDHNFLVSKLRSQVQDLKSENMALKDMLNRTEKVYKKEFERLGTELEWVQKSNEQLQKYCYLLSSLDSHVSQSEVSDEIGRILNINH